jgi:hypothetical protein
MDFTPKGIKKEAMTNDGYIGKWDGKPIYGLTYNDIMKNGERNRIYIAYDIPELPIISINQNGDAYVIANITDRSGTVKACPIPIPCDPIKTSEPPRELPISSVAPPTEDPVIGDVLLGLVVEDVLASARTKTIDSMLEGFLQ